jgi:hypothetical protein
MQCTVCSVIFSQKMVLVTLMARAILSDGRRFRENGSGTVRTFCFDPSILYTKQVKLSL